MAIATELDLVLTADGLTPGKAFEASFAYEPDDGSAGFNVGANAVVARPNGSIRFVVDRAECVGPSVTPGRIHAWVREKGSGFNGPPVESADGELSIDVRVEKV